MPLSLLDSFAEPRIAKRAASVPVGQPENSRLESLQSSKQSEHTHDHIVCAEVYGAIEPSLLDVPPSSMSSPVIGEDGRQNTSVTRCVARRRKHDSSSRAAGCIASTSASVAKQVADTGELRPRKRRKRSSSTPTVPRSSRPSSQLPSHRRSRSRVGSPTTDVEYVPQSRASSRRLRKIHLLLDSRISDIYAHLADPDSAGNLLSEPPAGSFISSTPNGLVGSQLPERTRGRQRKISDLTDENEKRELMEEWARMRQSQGTLLFSGTNGSACSSQTLSREIQGSGGSAQLEMKPRRNSPGANLAKYQTATTGVSQSQETALDDHPRGFFLTKTVFEDALPVGTDASRKKLDHKDSALSPEGSAQATTPSSDTESPSTLVPDSCTDEGSLIGKPAGDLDHSVAQDLGFCSPSLPASPSRKDFVRDEHTSLTEPPIEEQVEALKVSNSPKDSHSVTLPHSYSFDAGGIHLDSDEEFHMLELQEVFTLPWAPVSSYLYVPPNLGKLISGMKEQLMIEARARRRVEELYHAELNRRISAEKIVEGLREELEEKRDFGKPTC